MKTARTMIRIASAQLVQVTPTTFVADASDLGVLAGQPAPDTIQVVAPCGMTFVFARGAVIPAPEREVAGWEYHHGTSATLTLYND